MEKLTEKQEENIEISADKILKRIDEYTEEIKHDGAILNLFFKDNPDIKDKFVEFSKSVPHARVKKFLEEFEK